MPLDSIINDLCLAAVSFTAPAQDVANARRAEVAWQVAKRSRIFVGSLTQSNFCTKFVVSLRHFGEDVTDTVNIDTKQ